METARIASLRSSAHALAIERIVAASERPIVVATAQQSEAAFPSRGVPSHRVHSRDEREPSDLLWHGLPIAIRVYALETLAAVNGAILLIGAGRNRTMLLHTAEQRAGRGPFIRCARCSDGHIVRVQAGGRSERFTNLGPVRTGLATAADVDSGRWTVI
jgi:hypothetical protein